MKISLLHNFFTYVSIKSFEESFLILELEMTEEKIFLLKSHLMQKYQKIISGFSQELNTSKNFLKDFSALKFDSNENV
jgi:hypothetical protein